MESISMTAVEDRWKSLPMGASLWVRHRHFKSHHGQEHIGMLVELSVTTRKIPLSLRLPNAKPKNVSFMLCWFVLQ